MMDDANVRSTQMTIEAVPGGSGRQRPIPHEIRVSLHKGQRRFNTTNTLHSTQH